MAGPADAARDTLDPAGLTFVARFPLIGEGARFLEPSLTTRYVRSTLLVGRDHTRVTLDADLQAETPDGRSVTLPGMVIIETKSAGAPSEGDRCMWSMGFRPVRLSKYCIGLAVLRPELPSNRWTRALRQPWLVHEPDVHDRLAMAG